MVMRLLNKSDIAKAKANEQRMNVEEGLKLAKRVDNLREVAAQEEVSLAKFRKEQIAKINEEITKAEGKKSSLFKEVKDLEERRKELQKPLDDEWSRINKERLSLESFREEVAERSARVNDKEQGVREALEKAGRQLAQAATKNDLSSDKLREADSAAKAASKSLENAKKVEAQALALKEKAEKEVAERLEKVALREKGADNREKENTRISKELKNKERAINDKYKTLLRSQKRYG